MRKASFVPDIRGIWKFLIDPESDWKPKILVVLAVLYLFWPLDLLPDIAPLLGWLDDLGLISIATAYLVYASQTHRKKMK